MVVVRKLPPDTFDAERRRNGTFPTLRAPVWHRIQCVTVLPKPTAKNPPWTAQDACKISGCDFEIRTVPTLAPDPWNLGRFIQDDTEVAIVRGPTRDDPVTRRLGNAKSSLHPMANMDVARAIDEALTGRFPVESMGALGVGETLFVCLDAGRDEIAGEPYHRYLVITDGKAANRALTIMVTDVRLPSYTTLLLGLERTTFTHKLRHTAGVDLELEDRLAMIDNIQAGQDNVKAALEHLAKTRVTAEQARDIVDHAYPIPRKPSHVINAERLDLSKLPPEKAAMAQDRIVKYEYWVKAFQAQRDLALQGLERFNDENPRLAGTAYAVLLAVTENEDYRRGNKRDDGNQAAESALFGERATNKLRAYQRAAEVARSPYSFNRVERRVAHLEIG